MTLDDRLPAAGQKALARALARLDGERRERLRRQVEELDLDLVGRLVGALVGDEAPPRLGRIEPLAPEDVIRLPRTEADRALERRAREAGEEALAAGRVAAVLLAGGQGTRLGFDGPKGAFPFSPITGTTLFAHHAAKIAALRRRYGASLPWYVLTSPQNDAATRAFFSDHDDFGLAPDPARFIVQGTLPAVDRADGSILLEAPDRLALSPDGHGGLLPALRAAAALDDMSREGVRTIFTFQVDNPLLSVCRPDFVGHHLLAGADMSSMAVRKLGPEERMGVIARVDGRAGVVEYSDLPDELEQERDPDGELAYWAGSIAVHCIEARFVRELTEGGLRLPFHRALKRVPHIDADGRAVEPDEPNAVKFETFLFDALPAAERTVTMEVRREDMFSPIKNAEGPDSPATARRDLNRMYARWLAAAGVAVPPGPDGEPVDLEIDPRYALDADELAQRLPAGFSLSGPTVIPPAATP
jgi:UDP-N-acetylglucosamine/UDP-N-acetylgalactosamine diphosphorylase